MGNQCTLDNDTKYPVRIEDYDSNRMLEPWSSQGNWLAKGGNYYIELEIQFPDGNSTKRSLLGSDFNNERKYISNLFSDVIRDYERRVREREEAEQKKREKERADKELQEMLGRRAGRW